MTIDSIALLILLLMAAAALGWLLAQVQRGSRRDSRFKLVSAEYFKGLNYLLNEQPDKAIEIFVKMAEVDSETVETHFALASLFRRRGEVDRAIRIHQNLIARPSLTRMHRAQALFELSQDYLRAGLLDRAENILLDMLDTPVYTEITLRSLISLYEQQKDWEQAIAMRRRLQAVTGMSEEPVIAQYFCELAQTALASSDAALASRFLKRAQSHDPDCVRASLVLAHMAEREQDWSRSLRQYRKALQQDVRFATEVLPVAAKLASRNGDPAFITNLLRELREREPEAVAHIALAAILDPALNDPVARECMVDYLSHESGLRGLYDLYAGLAGHDGKALADIEPLRAAARKLLQNGPRYRCEECGFQGRTLYWQCPSCKTWNSTTPFHEISFAAAAPQHAG
ncbi:MAG TPA: lipopolysaccharide assembly protein LapB [Gammaproteobacteria bacterium]|nr:lipopolysaccharide assembly protein LapB [Gammaproteobacteria bacterium]